MTIRFLPYRGASWITAKRTRSDLLQNMTERAERARKATEELIAEGKRLRRECQRIQDEPFSPSGRG